MLLKLVTYNADRLGSYDGRDGARKVPSLAGRVHYNRLAFGARILLIFDIASLVAKKK